MRQSSFGTAVKTMPACIDSSYDPLQHISLDDLYALGQFECNLFDEQDDGALIKNKKEYRAVKRWMEKTR